MRLDPTKISSTSALAGFNQRFLNHKYRVRPEGRTLYEYRKLDDRSVTLTMTVEKKDETAADAETKDAIEAIASAANAPTEERDYLNIDVKKEITKNGQSESEETVTETGNLIDISIAYDLSGKTDAQISLYQFHDGEATKLGTSANDKCYYTLDRARNLIVLHTKLFSTYVIGYNPDATEPAAPSGPSSTGHTGHSGSSGGAIVYTPDINTPQHGKVSVDPKSASTGNVVTIIVEPDEGYAVDSVTVTNQSGDKVRVTKVNETTYTFLQPAGKVKIDVSFKEAAAPVTTGPVTAPQPDVFDAFTDLDKDAWMFLLDFPDAADVSAWADEAMHWMVMKEIITGMGDGTLNPGGEATRAQVATMLMRYHALTTAA